MADEFADRGVATQDSSADDASKPWNQDPRFREDLASVKEFKANKADFEDFKKNRDTYKAAMAERDALVSGQDPRLQAFAERIAGETKAEVEGKLKAAGLYEAYSTLTSAEQRAVVEDAKKAAEAPKAGMSREEIEALTESRLEARLAERDNVANLNRDFENGVAASALGKSTAFKEECRVGIPQLMAADINAQRDHEGRPCGKTRPMAEYVKVMEDRAIQMVKDHQQIEAERRATQARAPRTLNGTGAGVAQLPRAEALKLAAKFEYERLEAEQRAARK